MTRRTTTRFQSEVRARSEAVKTPITRRSLLRGLGAGALCLGLPVWRRLEAEAQTTQVRPRFIGFFTPNGTVKSQFFPSAKNQPTGSSILAPLAPYSAQVNVLKGVHMDSTVGDNKPGGPHMKGPAAMLTGGYLLEGSYTGAGGPAGLGNSISVDQVLAKHLGGDTAYRSLEFGVDIRGQAPLRYISYRGPNQPNPAVDDPWAMYDRVFAKLSSDGSPEALRDKLRKKTVLDYSASELRLLARRLPSEDRPRLEAHLTHLRSIEQRLNAASKACTGPTKPGSKKDLRDPDNYPAIGRLQMDLMYHAHACDLTRVSTFMWSNADSWQRMPWLGISEEHHALSHEEKNPAVAAKLQKINIWYSQQIAYFLGLLKALPDGNSTMLDSSLVLWGNELGQGNHTHLDIPWVTVGSAGGKIRTGRFLAYGDKPHNNLLLTVLHAFGMTSETSFGARENCTGILPDLLI